MSVVFVWAFELRVLCVFLNALKVSLSLARSHSLAHTYATRMISLTTSDIALDLNERSESIRIHIQQEAETDRERDTHKHPVPSGQQHHWVWLHATSNKSRRHLHNTIRHTIDINFAASNTSTHARTAHSVSENERGSLAHSLTYCICMLVEIWFELIQIYIVGSWGASGVNRFTRYDCVLFSGLTHTRRFMAMPPTTSWHMVLILL